MPSVLGRRGKVLIVDDDEQYLKLTMRLLRTAGYEVVARSSPIGSTLAVAEERPDMVLIDVNMPALDGDRLASLIQGAMEQPPLLVLYSGSFASNVKERAIAHGVRVIPKGLPPQQFLERVATLLQRRFERLATDADKTPL